MNATNDTPKQRMLKRYSALETERSSWINHWRELNDNFMPRSARFSSSDRNQGTKKHNAILDNSGLLALRVLAAGMMSGMTSPARPWMRLATPDPDMMDYGPVKEWLAQVARIMFTIFARSNTYTALHQTYRELGCYGTHAAISMQNFENVVHHYNSPTGEYMLAQDFLGNINTLYRKFERTVGEIVDHFGFENCSITTKNLYTQCNYEAWVPLIHCIEPRRKQDREPGKIDGKNKPFASVYMEVGHEGEHQVLRNSGFDSFQALCPRWDKYGGDVYGQSPGMEALGDGKQLGHEQLRKANAIDYSTKPPIGLPTSAKGQEKQLLPGGVLYYDGAGPQKVQSLWEVNTNLQHLKEDILDVRERIRSAFYSDLFLMLASADKNMTATEVAERHEEKLLMLGPVLERLHAELLGPLINNTFDQMIRNNLVPPPPEELQGQDLDVEFVSMLAQAQRAIGVNNVDRFVANIGVIAAFKPEVVDKLDADKWADNYADMLGVDPDIVVSNDKVALIRNERAKAQAQAAQAEQGNVLADTAAKLGTVDTSGQNAATDLLTQFSGYSAPGGAPVVN